MKTTIAVSGSIPTGLTCGNFVFKSFFSLGDSSSTNLSSREGNFDEAFYHNACARCKMPEHVLHVDVLSGHSEPLENLAETHLQKQLQNIRVPIKLVGHFKNKQKLGEKVGPLLVDGSKNIFLCRNRMTDTLELVKLWFEEGSWKLYSEEYVHATLIKGPARFFVADR